MSKYVSIPNLAQPITESFINVWVERTVIMNAIKLTCIEHTPGKLHIDPTQNRLLTPFFKLMLL